MSSRHIRDGDGAKPDHSSGQTPAPQRSEPERENGQRGELEPRGRGKEGRRKARAAPQQDREHDERREDDIGRSRGHRDQQRRKCKPDERRPKSRLLALVGTALAAQGLACRRTEQAGGDGYRDECGKGERDVDPVPDEWTGATKASGVYRA